jgi:hypothetical protein
MKLINTNSPTFPSRTGVNTIKAPNHEVPTIIPKSWDITDGSIVLVTNDTLETDLVNINSETSCH